MRILPTIRLEENSTRQGVLFMIAAILFFTLMDALAKGLTQRYEPMMVVWARYTGQVAWTLVMLSPILFRVIGTKHIKMQLLRSVLLFGATFSFYSGLSGLKLAQATAIFEVAPLILTGLAVLVLKEKVGLRRWAGVGAGMIGALIIIRPGTDVFTPYALFPLAAAFCYSAYAIATRFLGSEESAWTSFFYTGLFGALAASLMVAPVWETPSLPDAGIMVVLGAIGGLAQLLLIFAIRAAPASVLAPFSYVGLAFATLWGVFFFGEFPDGFTVMGAAVIVGAGLYVWYRETKVVPQRQDV
ncbi:drug/metabolite transporter (DMT)-like permease [Rubricella aquisinus]|uniref:Drug/metabolite transporter (DMT)-like permease n=1 Tax=Rubricella aquisinus TaxID=2028108 RepID=A0A840X6A1_9RHOB|nr:DMT family transporter [Rubricella aquisinus]MBB5516237.1 drug/metabolite transporter (DMT)-like permease [Rubricella aquisinus]